MLPEVQVTVGNCSSYARETHKRRRLTLHFTPTYASWLNQVEIWFNIFSRDVVKNGVWRSKQMLIKQIIKYIKQYNENRAHPFRWTYEGKPLQA